MKINRKQISEITGFSPATVSNALNNKRGVNKKTAQQILRTAEELGYSAETKLTSIKFVMLKKHGKVIWDSPFFSSLIEGVEKECRMSGYQTMICHLDQTDPEYVTLLEEVLKDKSSGILLLATELQQEDVELFQRAAAPVIVMDNWFNHFAFDSILINNTDAVHDAVCYLIAKGHKQIGYLKSDIRIKNFYYREQGYQRALFEHGLPFLQEYTFAVEPTMDGSYRCMMNHLAQSPRLPTAFFADNDIIALGVMKALKEYGYKIPEDISIIGFDDLPFCEISSPTLTTIKVFKQEMGQMAVRRLVDQIKGEYKVNMKIQICSEFVERESVKSLL